MSSTVLPKKVWFVSPVYFDVESYKILTNEILQILPNAHFIAVDDSGGKDSHIAELDAHNNIEVIQAPFNLGHQRSIVFGLRLAQKFFDKQDVVITLDSDGEDQPSDVPAILEKLNFVKNKSHGLVLVHRTKRQESPLFKIMYLCFKVGFQFLTGTHIRSGNFAAFHGAFLHRYINHPFFDLCYSSTLVSLNCEILRVPCPRGKRYAGTSKMNFTRLIMHGIRMLMPFMDRIAIRSLIFFAMTFGASVLLSFGFLFMKLFMNAQVPTWAGSILILSVLMSFLALGNFLTLFAFFSQSQGLALSHLEDEVTPQSQGSFSEVIKNSQELPSSHSSTPPKAS